MSTAIRSIPDHPFADLLSAALGVPLVVAGDVLGRYAEATTPNGTRCRVSQVRLDLPPDVVFTGRQFISLRDDFEAVRREFETLARWADLVQLTLRGLSATDTMVALAVARQLDFADSDDLVSIALQVARSRDLDFGDEASSPGAAFVDLVLALHELRVQVWSREAETGCTENVEATS